MKTTKQNKATVKLLGKILTLVIIILLALISFGGIFVKDANTTKNIIPEYTLGMDLEGAREIVIKPDDGTEIRKYDEQGHLITEEENEDETETEEENKNITEVEEPINDPELLTSENYKKVKQTIEERLKYMNASGYLLRFDEATGEIKLEVPENSSTDYIAQYSITKGEFKIADNDTSEVLLSNDDIKEAKVQYATDTTGTTVYLSIEFTKEATEKLKNISNTYISSTDSEGNTTTKQIKMTLDDETIISTYFQEEISDGTIQLSMGKSTNSADIQNNLQQASNIAVFLNTKPMPITYKMEINRFVYSDITADNVKVMIGIALVIAVIMAIAMIVKHRQNGIMGVVANIGFTAILLLAIRLGNVTVSLSGMFTIAVAVVIEYIITMMILKEYDKKLDSEITNKNIKSLLGRTSISLVPLLIMAITFAVMSWEEIASTGMILFWAILIMVIYNIIILAVRLYCIPTTNNTEKNEKNTTKTNREDKIRKDEKNNTKKDSKKKNK